MESYSYSGHYGNENEGQQHTATYLTNIISREHSKSQKTHRKGHLWGSWLAQSIERMTTLDLRLLSMSPTVGHGAYLKTK